MTTAVKVNGMSKQQKHSQRQWKPEDNTIVVKAEDPQPKRYVPPEHQSCMALRSEKDTRYGEVRSTQTLNTPTETIVTRYCRCRFCGSTYQDVTIIKH